MGIMLEQPVHQVNVPTQAARTIRRPVMAVEDPGTLTVTCDQCGKDTEMDTTTYGNDGVTDTYGVDRQTMEDLGWDIQDGTILCPKCIKERNAEEEELEEEEEECEECNGTGIVHDENGDPVEDGEDCPECGGSGLVTS
jgi:ssDNA-binding Zn-finger/Zn-ribbon topoisomerase 1